MTTATSVHGFFSSGTWLVTRNLLVFFAVVFWIAFAYWVNKDARRRIEDPWLVGMATLLVTHDQEEAFELSERVVVMHEGKVAQVDSPRSAGFTLKLGARIDLLNTASGHLILAFQQSAMRDRALAEWKRRTRRRLPGDLARHLARIRARGFEEMASYQVKGVTNIAFPVLNQHAEAIAALSVPFLARIRDSVGPENVKAALRKASHKLSNAVGGKNR